MNKLCELEEGAHALYWDVAESMGTKIMSCKLLTAAASFIWTRALKHKSESWSQAWFVPLFFFQCLALVPCCHCRPATVRAVFNLHLHRLKSWPRHHDPRPQPNPLLSNRLPNNPHSLPTHNNPPYLLLTRTDRTDTTAINTLRVRLPFTVSLH